MKRTAALLLTAAAGMLLARCGSLSLDPLAGGSGAGNPGGDVVSSASVMFSMVAVGGDDEVLGIARPLAKTGTILDGTESITVTDGGGLRLTLREVVLSNVGPRFTLDSALRPDSLLSHMDDPPEGLTCDSNSILMDGRHAFDAVEGTIDSSDGWLRLPVARYSGVGFIFEEHPFDYHFLQPPPYSMITMRGSFLWGGAVHDLVVAVNYAPESCRQQFRFGGGFFTLTAGDTTHLELQLDAQQWFANIDFGAALAEGALFFDGAGALNISNASLNPCVWGIQSVMATDFFASGKLVVY